MQYENKEKPRKGVLVPSRCLLLLSSPPSARGLGLWDVGCFHSIKPFLAAATFPPDLGHVGGQRDAGLGSAKFSFTSMTQIHPERFSLH